MFGPECRIWTRTLVVVPDDDTRQKLNEVAALVPTWICMRQVSVPSTSSGSTGVTIELVAKHLKRKNIGSHRDDDVTNSGLSLRGFGPAGPGVAVQEVFHVVGGDPKVGVRGLQRRQDLLSRPPTK